ncbi:uncharacterized protein BJX67DRAFT_35975 [Aspergillus lucknowensis]|uniref:Uncharacterized protein n=1 Tax=Aspergillus lucknowensis TaxID=176173 RepID=A0ABR4LW30_9EURO
MTQRALGPRGWYVLRAWRMDHCTNRKKAGKVLVELLYEPEMDSQICEELNNNGCLRPIVSVLNDSDIVLSCFSSTILQRFHPSKAQSNPAWELNGSDSGKFDMIQSKGSPVEQYYSYMRAKGKPPLNGIGVGRRPCTLGEPLYYLLESDGKETELLPQGSILLGMGTGRLDFVLCRKDSMGWVFDYMTLRTMKRSRTRCIIFNAAGGQKPLLSFHINAGDSLTVNDQERSLEAFSLRMTTADDLAGLRRGLEAMGIRSQLRRTRASPSVPRPSSLMIPLDNTDYIAQKSSGFSDPPTEEAIGHAVHSVRWGNELSNLIAQASRVSETGSENLSQSALTELTRTPPAYESSPSRDRNISHPVDLKPIPESGQTDKGSPCEPNIPLESSKNGEESVRGSKYVGSLGETRPRNEREASWTGPASNTRSRRSQNGTMPPANTLSKPMLPNTQESLIFPERRSRGKLYTAQTKTVMNRVEDLRTSNSYAEREVHADTELTSATSPLPGGSGSTFNRNSKKQSSGAKKRKSAAKAKEQSKGKGRGKGCTNESAKPLPLPTDTNATDDSRKGGHVKVLVEDAGQTIEADRHETCDSPVPGLSDMLNHLHHALKPIQSTSQAFHISVPQDRATPNDTVVYGPQSLVESENANDRIHAFGYPNDGQCLGENHQGRGQTVAEKLIAAFGESSTVQPREQSKATCPNEKEGVEIVRHSPRSQKVNSDDGLRVNTLLHVEDEKPDMPGSSAANMTLQGASVYEPSPHVSSTGTQKRSLQATKSDSLNWILGKRNAASGLESKYDRKRTRRTSSLLTSSSVEPRSTQSAVESAQTSSQGQTGREDRVLEQPLENAVSPFASIKISGLPDAEETSDEIPIHDTGGNGHMPSVRPRGGNGQPRSDRTGEALNSSSKTIVDEDGSPRLLHRGKNGQSSSKRGELFHNGEQQSAVQRRNVSYKAKGAQGAEDGPFAVVCERGDAGPEGETAKPTDGPNADANVVDNASYSTVSGRNESSIMNGDGPTSGVLQSVPDQSSKTQEQSFRGENSDRCPKEHLSVDRLFGGGGCFRP